jgi:transcriptional regulator of arginine metabolism
MANKRERQATIRELIDARPIESQEELRRLLLQRGWDVTQSTLSRDLRDMRLARVPTGDGSVRYRAADAVPPGEHPELETVLPQFFARVDGVGELIVLRTLAGGAQPVAEALDTAAIPDVLGTIAGENTVLVICRSPQARERVMRRLTRIGGRPRPGP